MTNYRTALLGSLFVSVLIVLASCGNGGAEIDAAASTSSQQGDPVAGTQEPNDEIGTAAGNQANNSASSNSNNSTDEQKDDDADVSPSADSDGDGYPDDVDNCPMVLNIDQADDDGDGIGNSCDDIILPGEPPCGPLSFGEVAEIVESGDNAATSICLPSIIQPPGFPPGTVLVQTESYVILDLTSTQIAQLESEGFNTVSMQTLAGLGTVDLVELRIRQDSRSALATTKTVFLDQVSPDVVEAIPTDVLVDQPDATLQALPADFWNTADGATIEAIGQERLSFIIPDIFASPGSFTFELDGSSSSDADSGQQTAVDDQVTTSSMPTDQLPTTSETTTTTIETTTTSQPDDG